MFTRLLIAAIALTTVVNAKDADTIYIGGTIWTANENAPTAEAMAIKGDKILAVGDKESVLKHAGESTEIVTLTSEMIVPGFQDGHTHFTYIGSKSIKLDGVKSVDDIQNLIKDFDKENPDARWITGMGWAYAAFPNKQAHRKYIDQVMPDKPVYLVSRDGHMGVANTKALELAGITSETPDPKNGRIVRDENGVATGELQEHAEALVQNLIPPPTDEERYQAFVETMDAAAAHGLTAVHEAGFPMDRYPLLERALKEGKLKQRFHLAGYLSNFDPRNPMVLDIVADNIEKYSKYRDSIQSPYIELRSIKGMLDGTIDAGTASMFDPYVGSDNKGIPFWQRDNLNKAVAMMDKAGFQLMIHAIGDKAISMALDAFAYAQEQNGNRDSRHRVEHAEMPRLDDLKRFRDLGVIASTQTMFANPDDTVLTNFAVLLGPKRAQYADNFAIWDEAGVRQIFGSDYPVMTFDVLRGIEVAVTRMTEEGTPEGGWYPDGRVSVEAALTHYTIDNAFADFEEDERGSLEAGKFADYVILSRDITAIDPTQISETDVLKTVMGGKVTYKK